MAGQNRCRCLEHSVPNLLSPHRCARKHRQRHGAPDVVVLLVQEEFAERLTLATPADRGSLGICTALGWEGAMERRVPPGAFRPPPAVMSRVCVLRPIDHPTDVDHRLVANGPCRVPSSPPQTAHLVATAATPLVPPARLARCTMESGARFDGGRPRARSTPRGPER